MARSTPMTLDRHVPGEPGVWILVLGDMVIFGLLFGTFMFYRAEDPALYARSQLLLNRNLGALNTLLLLCSSWFVAMAVQCAKAGRPHGVAPRLSLAFLCGLGFIVVKIVEYSQKLTHDIAPSTNDFFMFYFVLTGVHFLHLLLGMVILSYLCLRFRAKACSPNDLIHLESGATFWHLVDLLWIVLFPLLYLLH